MKQSSLLLWSQANRNPQEIQLAKSIPWSQTIFLWKYFVNSSARPRVEEERRLVPASVLPTSSSITSAPNTPPMQMHHHHIHHKHHQCTCNRPTTPVHHQCRWTITRNSTPGPPLSVNKNQLHQHQCTTHQCTSSTTIRRKKNASELQNKFRLISACRKYRVSQKKVCFRNF